MKYLLHLVFLLIALFLLSPTITAQPKFTFQGDYNYVLNKPLNGVFALTPDGSKGVTLTSNTGVGRITSFDPVTGVMFDSKMAGFTPVEIKIASLNGALKVVVLSAEGGPRAVTIFDMNQNGILTQIARTQLTNSGSDTNSNLILSARGRAGFARVTQGGSKAYQIVSFSLDDGSILNRLNIGGSALLELYEDAGHTLIASGNGYRVVLINADNPSQLVSAGQVNLPDPQGTTDMNLKFSADGHYLFAAGPKLFAIDTKSQQVVGIINNPNYFAQTIKIFENNGTRLIAIFPGANSGIALINAIDPTNLIVVSEIGFDTGDPFIRDFTFSRNGKKLILARGLFSAIQNGLKILSVPELNTISDIPLNEAFAFKVETFGQPERIISAWGSNNNFTATIYSLPNRTNSQANFDLDGKTDLSVFRPSNGFWYLLQSSDNNFRSFQFGQQGDEPVGADYDGDGKTDFAVFRASTGTWLIDESSTNTIRTIQLGERTGDKPIPADYDGDGKTDPAIFRRNPNRWSILQSSNNNLVTRKWGFGSGKPVIGDFDGDGKDDLVYFNMGGVWQILNSSTDIATFQQFGLPSDTPISGDFDNDGRDDLAVFRPSNGTWYIQQSFNGFKAVQFGLPTDKLVPADYDGDGKTDIAVFRPANGTWFVLQSSNSTFRSVQFGAEGDIPAASNF